MMVMLLWKHLCEETVMLLEISILSQISNYVIRLDLQWSKLT